MVSGCFLQCLCGLVRSGPSQSQLTSRRRTYSLWCGSVKKDRDSDDNALTLSAFSNGVLSRERPRSLINQETER